jgi:hypothetical protein
MANFTVSIPRELKAEIDKYPEINLPEYLKKRFQVRIIELKKFDELKSLGKI